MKNFKMRAKRFLKGAAIIAFVITIAGLALTCNYHYRECYEHTSTIRKVLCTLED